MENNPINPVLSTIANLLMTKLFYPTIEYRKDNLTEDSYIFAPNHTTNIDVYLIWSLLSKNYNIDLFMKKEFWDHFPNISKIMQYFNIFPITRDKLNLQEIELELERLKDKNKSLVMFPQGRHVDPQIILNLFEYNFKTLPLGTFYISAFSSKPIMPIYMESQKMFSRNTIVYGSPLDPLYYEVLNKDGSINKKNLLFLAKEWLLEIKKTYQMAQDFEGRKMRAYELEKFYYTAKGIFLGKKDPNVITNYIEEIKQMSELSQKTGIDDIQELGSILEIEQDSINQIKEVQKVYQNYLERRR